LKRTVRILSVSWLLVFAMMLLLSPVQAFAETTAPTEEQSTQGLGQQTANAPETESSEQQSTAPAANTTEPAAQPPAGEAPQPAAEPTEATETVTPADNGAQPAEQQPAAPVKEAAPAPAEPEQHNGHVPDQRPHPEKLKVNAVPETDKDLDLTLLTIDAQIPGAKKKDKIKGKWIFKLKDTETGEIVDKVSFRSHSSEESISFPIFESGTYQGIARFKGTYNGEKIDIRGRSDQVDVEVKEEETFEPKHEVNHTYKNGKHTVTASILEGEEVTGMWVAAILDEEGVPVTEPQFSDPEMEGHTFTAEFADQLEPGRYSAAVYFYGEVDGQPAEFEDAVEFEVKKQPGTQPGDGGQPNDNPGHPGSDNPGHSGQKTSDDKVTIQKPVQVEKPQQTTDHVQNGGTLPKTDVPYPLGMLMGAALLLLGAAVWSFRLQKG
jgi:hypothetical protein